jgi:hypothetical protein
MMRREAYLFVGTDPRRIDNCIEGSDSTRDGEEYEEGGYSISIGIGIGVAFMVCMSINCQGNA